MSDAQIEQRFGTGMMAARARSDFAGPDTLVCTLEDALLSAERRDVEQQRVRESRMFLQVATADQFITVVEEIVHRKVRAFASASDPDPGVVWEVFSFEPLESGSEGDGQVS